MKAERLLELQNITKQKHLKAASKIVIPEINKPVKALKVKPGRLDKFYIQEKKLAILYREMHLENERYADKSVYCMECVFFKKYLYFFPVKYISYERNREIKKEKEDQSRILSISSKGYFKGILKHSGFSNETIEQYPALIEIKKGIILTKREITKQSQLNSNDNTNKQRQRCNESTFGKLSRIGYQKA